MKKFAYASTFVGALALVACGGGDNGVTIDPDGGSQIDSGGQTAACNPVTQQGCESGEKCSWLVENPDLGLGRTACVANGNVPAGGSCARDEGGVDNCEAGENVGYLCSGGECIEICGQQPSSTCSDGICVLYNGLFDDLERVGLCNETCEPHLQDCPVEGEACYSMVTGQPADPVVGVCAGVPLDAENYRQNDECLKGPGGNCFLNGCAGGYGPELLADGAQSIDRCAYYCEPIETYFDSDTDEVVGGPAAGNDSASNGRNASCFIDTSGGGHHCRFLASAYSFGASIDPANVSKTHGFCAGTDTNWGDCTEYSPKEIVEELNRDPEPTQAEFDQWCNDTGKCAFGCVTPETLDGFFQAAMGKNAPEFVHLPPHLRGKGGETPFDPRTDMQSWGLDAVQ